jgi:hypothetical protein
MEKIKMIDEEFNKELYGRFKERLFKKIEDIHKDTEATEMTREELEKELDDPLHDFISEFFQKMLLHTEPLILLHAYLEAITDVLFVDGIEEEFNVALESVTKLIKAGKTRAVVDNLKDKIFDEIYEIKEVRVGNQAVIYREPRNKGNLNEKSRADELRLYLEKQQKQENKNND